MKKVALFVMLILLSIGCKQTSSLEGKSEDANNLKEKEAILKALLDETKTAFARDYEAWKENWVHRKSVSKTYINFADSTFSEMTSWKEVDDFVRTYIEEHPEPVPPPKQPENVNIKLYGTGALVSYRIMDEVFGQKRETRLMEKEDGRWKIAGMHTTIYGFEKDEE